MIENFIRNAYTSVDDVYLEPYVSNSCISLIYFDFQDTIKVSILDGKILIASNNYSDIEYFCEMTEFCIDDYVNDILDKFLSSSQSDFTSFAGDEITTTVLEDEDDFSRLQIDRIMSDLSTVVVSKLVYEDNLIGYRFRLNNGCLDISIEKGRELGIVPYKIGKKVPLTAINGVLASNYECNNKVLFPDISSNDELCRQLVTALFN